MKARVQLIIESDTGAPEQVHEVAHWERGVLQPETLGLTLAESKEVLHGLQQAMVTHQVDGFQVSQAQCAPCGKPHRRKGTHRFPFRTLFGKLTLESPRYYTCACQPQPQQSWSPLAEVLKERTAPELLYLEVKFAARVSYGLTGELLTELLPIGCPLSTASLHRTVQQVAQRLEGELGDEQVQFIEGGPREWEQLPPPDPPLTVGLDGGYVHAREPRGRRDGWFEVITGKSVPAEGPSRCFALVNKYDQKPKRRLFEILKSQGLQMNQQVVFLSDGGDTVRQLPAYLSPESEHWLDWFHLTMRLTVMGNTLKGLAVQIQTAAPPGDEDEGVPASVIPVLEKNLERLKWNLWHGNVPRALQLLEDIDIDLEGLEPYVENAPKLQKAVRECDQYLSANRAFIPDFGDRYRHGEPISTAFVESTVNYVISKRMVKKQQMRWTPAGAHHLLQVRTRVLDDVLRADFIRWYPGMKADEAKAA
jgi:hypothetical protein